MRISDWSSDVCSSDLLGDSIATNLFMLGYAWQKGLVPLSAAAIDKAIELNQVAVEANRTAFLWGRRAAHDLAAVEKAAAPRSGPGDLSSPGDRHLSQSLDEVVARRVAFLTGYQDDAYAARYQALVEKARAAAAARAPGSYGLAGAVARYYFKRSEEHTSELQSLMRISYAVFC